VSPSSSSFSDVTYAPEVPRSQSSDSDIFGDFDESMPEMTMDTDSFTADSPEALSSVPEASRGIRMSQLSHNSDVILAAYGLLELVSRDDHPYRRMQRDEANEAVRIKS